MNFVQLRSYDNYISAHISMTMLQDAGINCHLKDEHIITLDPFLSPALGGMKLMVCCNCFNKADEETINFMEWYLSGETTDFWLMANLFGQAAAAHALIVNFM